MREVINSRLFWAFNLDLDSLCHMHVVFEPLSNQFSFVGFPKDIY